MKKPLNNKMIINNEVNRKRDDNMNEFGGITLDNVIIFQTQAMLGNQFNRVMNKSATKDDIMIACLRMGWNDAFRHVSKNKKVPDEKKEIGVLELKEMEWRKTHSDDYDDFICGNVLNQKELLDTFVEFKKCLILLLNCMYACICAISSYTLVRICF